MADMCIKNTPWMDKILLPGADAPQYFADSDARDEIKSLKDAVKGGTVFCGVYTSTKMEDGGSVPANVTPAGGTERAAQAGDLIINKYGDEVSREFVHDGTAWRELGSTGALKALAYKDSASTEYTPGGSVSLADVKAAGSVSLDGVTAAGSVSLTGVKATGDVSLAEVKAEGTVSLANVKSAGSVSGTAVSLGCSVGDVYENTYCFCATNHELIIGCATAKSFVQSVCVAGVTDPTFTGDNVTGTASFTGTSMCGTATFCGSGLEGTASFTGSGMCGTATFCGSGMEGTASFTGTCATITVS